MQLTFGYVPQGILCRYKTIVDTISIKSDNKRGSKCPENCIRKRDTWKRVPFDAEQQYVNIIGIRCQIYFIVMQERSGSVSVFF